MLFEIDPATYQVDVDRAKAEVDRAEAKLKLATAKFAYLKQQQTSGNTPVPLVNESEQQIARADLQMARANLEAAQLRLGWTRITAPIGGYISGSTFDVGSLVKAEETTLSTIASLDPVYVSITMGPETWFALRHRIQQGELKSTEVPVEVYVPITGKRQGFLEFSEDAAFDSTSGGTVMRVRVPNQDAALVAGLFVTVRYQEGKPHPALLIPEKALAVHEGKYFVWVLGEHNIPERREVNFSRQYENNMHDVTRGLTTDDWIIRDVDSYSRLSRGLPIDPKRLP